MRTVLAFKNFTHDGAKLALIVGGIAFSVLLVYVQLALFLGFRRMTSEMIDHASTALWIVPGGTTSFDDPAGILTVQAPSAASVQNVARVRQLVVGFAQWQGAVGESTSTIIVGIGADSDATLP